ncbi:MAG TPA: exodeoxyribonuclease VII large subunit [Candidatus Elarobacter sp.]|jgi:exodeoxyribonuclease VII large subunit|nr:exodeoxyribonuclease VII large subunit [Candidatus Elarobacter sp.]
MTAGERAEVRIVAVSRLANYIAGLFSRERAFARLGVRGEISNLRAQPNGNTYFDLKDRDALLNCVAFSEAAASFPELANGDEIVAYGSVVTYAKASRYQLRVLDVVAEGGAGALHRRYEALKARLTAEGLFAPERKRPLPRYPFRVALVTSEAADGARDFRTQAAARAPHVEVIVVPTPVQGERAAPEIARAIALANAMDVDVIVVARGGGSFEDLFAFSEERVVRALAASRVPTVSAIGHEADAPLTDFVADHRAATPSAAAQTILPRRDELLALVGERKRTLIRDADRAVATRRQHVDVASRHLLASARERIRRSESALVALERRLAKAAPAERLAQRRGRFEQVRERLGRAGATMVARRGERVAQDAARLRLADPMQRVAREMAATGRRAERLDAAMQRFIERRRARFEVIAASLSGHDPETILQRGYAIVEAEDGRSLTDAALVPPGSLIRARLARGSLTARVEREGTHGGRQISLF